jgi:hypothetical protein
VVGNLEMPAGERPDVEIQQCMEQPIQIHMPSAAGERERSVPRRGLRKANAYIEDSPSRTDRDQRECPALEEGTRAIRPPISSRRARVSSLGNYWNENISRKRQVNKNRRAVPQRPSKLS